MRKTIALILLVSTVTYANVSTQEPTKHYTQMTTHELQVAVEKLSQTGELPFEMGLELMKRWKDA